MNNEYKYTLKRNNTFKLTANDNTKIYTFIFNIKGLLKAKKDFDIDKKLYNCVLEGNHNSDAIFQILPYLCTEKVTATKLMNEADMTMANIQSLQDMYNYLSYEISPAFNKYVTGQLYHTYLDNKDVINETEGDESEN